MPKRFHSLSESQSSDDSFEILPSPVSELSKSFVILSMEDCQDFESVSDADIALARREASTLGAAMRVVHQHWNMFYYGFCFIDAVVFFSPMNAVASVGHLANVTARQYGYDVPNILNRLLRICVNTYQKSFLASKLNLVTRNLYSRKYDDAEYTFSHNLDKMTTSVGYEIYGRKFQLARRGYEGFMLCADLTDHRKILLWLLYKLREELIYRKIWPTLLE